MIVETGVLTFEPVKHHYKVDGILKRSVTGIIQDAGLVDTKWFTEESRQRGSAVHHGVRLLLEGHKLDPKTVDPRIVGYIKGAERFLSEVFVEPICVEVPMYHETLDYCGTMDLVARYGSKKLITIIDWKTGPVPDLEVVSPEALQMAFYKMLFEANQPGKIQKRLGVHLEKNGNYKLAPFIYDERDEAEARKLLKEAA